MDEAQFAAQFRPPAPGSAAEVLAAARATPDVRELAEAAEAERARAAHADRRERLAMLNEMNGRPLERLTAAQRDAAACRDEVQDLTEQLSRARERMQAAAEVVVDTGAEADAILSRSAQQAGVPGDMLAPAKAAHQEYVAASRAAWAAVQAGTPQRGRRPFARRSGGDDGPAEATCPDCRELGVTDAAEEQQMHAMIAEQRAKAAHIKKLEPFEIPAERRHAYSSGGREVTR